MLWHNSRTSAAIHSKFADFVTAVNMQTCNNTTLAKVGGRHISNPPKKGCICPRMIASNTTAKAQQQSRCITSATPASMFTAFCWHAGAAAAIESKTTNPNKPKHGSQKVKTQNRYEIDRNTPDKYHPNRRTTPPTLLTNLLTLTATSS